MSWDKPAPTITGGCTTLSKGRFGHPTALRTISVREAAILQTFPSDYIFETDLIDRACIIIGNALPPTFAKKMADICSKNLNGKIK
jgi:DNA (cytosine-5)-methyltransferase 1